MGVHQPVVYWTNEGPVPAVEEGGGRALFKGQGLNPEWR